MLTDACSSDFYTPMSFTPILSLFSAYKAVFCLDFLSSVIKFHFQEHGRLLGKGTKTFLSGSTLPPSKEKAEHGGSIWLGIHVKLTRLN